MTDIYVGIDSLSGPFEICTVQSTELNCDWTLASSAHGFLIGAKRRQFQGFLAKLYATRTDIYEGIDSLSGPVSTLDSSVR